MKVVVIVAALIGISYELPAKLDFWRHARAQGGYAYPTPEKPIGLYQPPTTRATTTTTTTTTTPPPPPPPSPPDQSYLPPKIVDVYIPPNQLPTSSPFKPQESKPAEIPINFSLPKPSEWILPPKPAETQPLPKPSTSYFPPRPITSYIPPKPSTKSPPTKPPTSYFPPKPVKPIKPIKPIKPVTGYVHPTTTTTTRRPSTVRPVTVYISPKITTTKRPPPPKPVSSYVPPPPNQLYLPPKPAQGYIPPQPTNQIFVTEKPKNMMLMPYEFEYGVDDPKSGNFYSHQEKSDGREVRGQYSVLLPDGRLQIVKFVSTPETGYVAEVSYQKLGSVQ